MATNITNFEKDADVPYFANAGKTTTGDHDPAFRIFVGTTETTKESGRETEGKNRAATGRSNTAGKFTLTSPSYKNGMAIIRYLRIKNSKETIKNVDTPAVVAGRVYPAIVDTAKEGVAATDAGTNRSEDGIPIGDADHEVALKTVGVTIFAFGGAGFTITLTST